MRRPAMTTPKIYLAGKIEKNCWRHRIVPGLREHETKNGPIETIDFTYMGPFFVGCDHGCFHGDSTHGALARQTGSCSSDLILSHQQVIHRCLKGVKNSDLLFAYINAPNCYGTLMEIQHAVSNGVEVVIAFSPCISRKDFWFACKQAQNVIEDVDESDLLGLIKISLGGAPWS